MLSAAALVAAACINPTSPSEEFEGRRLGALSLVPFLQVSVSPDPATAQASEDPDLPWTVEFTVTVREVAGADVEVSRITVGAQSHTSFNRDDITAAAGTNRIAGGESLDVPLSYQYRTPHGGPGIREILVAHGVDTRGTTLSGSTTLNVLDE